MKKRAEIVAYRASSFVKSRKSITNVSSRHINESIEKLDFSNTSQNRSLSYNEDNIINKPISKTVNAVASTSLPSASYSSATEKIGQFIFSR
ncbi:hypothetical protein DMN91_001624 [Ooceraea biroi]|uniref:Uncharacterized protein n=1 Tax=Ooceraea biroi TaxID=2015173 RepID=A0A3L8E094_OOCBI|nr:hypothetical protein DMN91_001624 [Ooceraea biroi]